MIVSFLYKTFIHPNVRTIPQPELASQLADYLYGLRERAGEESPFNGDLERLTATERALYDDLRHNRLGD